MANQTRLNVHVWQVYWIQLMNDTQSKYGIQGFQASELNVPLWGTAVAIKPTQ